MGAFHHSRHSTLKLPTMSAARAAFSLARRVPLRSVCVAPRSFATVAARRGKWDPKPGDPDAKLMPFDEIKTEKDLLPPGAEPGTVPTDLEQATGLERLEILGKMEGVDIFDMTPLDTSRKGTMEEPLVIRSAGEEQFAGCTGYPADSHGVKWLRVTRDRPIERCPECSNVYQMEYVGPQDDHHHHHEPEHPEPQTFADYIKPEYRYR